MSRMKTASQPATEPTQQPQFEQKGQFIRQNPHYVPLGQRYAALEKVCENLEKALNAALEWIDAVPKDTPLPTMPGVDRDWINSSLDNYSELKEGDNKK